eukprot:SAG31_NODE_15698_length_742_cov_1.272162_1_plen_116_part_00
MGLHKIQSTRLAQLERVQYRTVRCVSLLETQMRRIMYQEPRVARNVCEPLCGETSTWAVLKAISTARVTGVDVDHATWIIVRMFHFPPHHWERPFVHVDVACEVHLHCPKQATEL